MSPLEIVGALLGLACVWLTVRQHVACWPVGIAMVVLYIFIFYDAKLYSDMLLQVIYVFLQIYGWWAWSHGGDQRQALPVNRLAKRAIVPWCLICGLATTSLGGAMAHYTDASFPYVDAFATSASLIAQWLMGRKTLESWLVWIVVDIVSIGLYLAKSLYPTAGLYIVFLGLAIYGWREWSVSWRATVMA
jgi:nicotinamide mononucleotide transporter